MVLKCTNYTTRITLNVSQTGCTVASQLGFEPGSLVWQADSLPIKPSEPATDNILPKLTDETRVSYLIYNPGEVTGNALAS